MIIVYTGCWVSYGVGVLLFVMSLCLMCMDKKQSGQLNLVQVEPYDDDGGEDCCEGKDLVQSDDVSKDPKQVRFQKHNQMMIC